MRFAYADPPYPGLAHYYTEKSEVDHAELLRQLMNDYPDGWALSTSAKALPYVLRLCPVNIRVCAWFKNPRGSSAWEPVLIQGGRKVSQSSTRDALQYGGRYRAFPGALIGMKPPQFAEWIFSMLGARSGDAFVDLFPGSGAVSEAWRRYTSRTARGDTSRTPASDTSRGAAVDTSRRDLGDISVALGSR